ncbi:hypothetical protein PO903_09810 [Paenibacillus sp. PK4536]|uniref:hypothetical protein n=1 Tax=Paenibacillus sp. PK4536 TaxID=3024576 RepID=UPI002359C3E7|nr:hypothetical protein [Paenibacillus sp. PK4536]WIM41140.1 hypothetical protein PO903_09810 [Paenibacillus sp. PK4536]
MSDLFKGDKELLESLMKKILIYRFTRNIDKILHDNKISHHEISMNSGRNNNWFNRTFNDLEDMRISSFLKMLSAMNKLSGNTKNQLKPFNLEDILGNDVLDISSILNDLNSDDLDHLLQHDKELAESLNNLKFYFDTIQGFDSIVSKEEIDAYDRIIKIINHKEDENG